MEQELSMTDARTVRVADYIELLKPELTGLSVLTAICAALLASSEAFDLTALIGVGVGTLLVGGGAGGFNQVFERKYDALMKRTERRPVASGRLLPGRAAVFSLILSLTGLLVLLLMTTPLAAMLASVTLSSYLFVYTPLKRISPLATLIGGIPGALPPLIGWAGITNELSLFSVFLFSLLFFWQMPHFYSLAWMYRKDYARAGFQLLPAIDDRGVQTGYHIVGHSFALVLVTVFAGLFGLVTHFSMTLGIVVGTAYLAVAVRFLIAAYRTDAESRIRANRYSRQLFFGSLVYLPVLMGLLLLDRFNV